MLIMTELTGPGAAAGPRAPGLRRVVAGLVLAEAVVVAGYGFFLAVETVAADATDRVAAGFLAVMTIALGAGLALGAWAVAHGRRAARAPVLTWQILQIALAVPAVTVRWYVGVPLLAVAVVTAVAVMRQDVLPSQR
jgi:hypothetical protein